MELKGKLVEIFPIKKGISKGGKEWQMQEILLSVQSGNYENKVVLQVKEIKYPIGATLTCQLNIKATEFNGKWFNNVSAWKIESDEREVYSPDAGNGYETTPNFESNISNPSDDLPF